MMQDILNNFSNGQDITATAVSTNVIDMGDPKFPSGIAAPGAAPHGGMIFVYVDEDFVTLTSLSVSIQTSSDDGASDAYTNFITRASIPVAELTAGSIFHLGKIPIGAKRYVRLNYTVGGTNATAGSVTAGFVMDVDANF